MKQASLIAAISMAVLATLDLFNILHFFDAFFITYLSILLGLIKIAAKLGVGFFFLTLYKKQK